MLGDQFVATIDSPAEWSTHEYLCLLHRPNGGKRLYKRCTHNPKAPGSIPVGIVRVHIGFSEVFGDVVAT